MANSSFYPLSGCEIQAEERQTALALCVVHLFKSTLTPTPSTTKTELTAAEADYDEYATETITSWSDPMLAPGTGYQIIASALFGPLAADQVVPNMIGGLWIEDAGGVAREVTIFDPPLPMQVAGQAIPCNFFDLFPTGFAG